MTTTTPPLEEFINLEQRRVESLRAHGIQKLEGCATVAVYETVKNLQTLTIRIADDLAEQFGLKVGQRMVCHVHPDQKHLALLPGNVEVKRTYKRRPSDGRRVQRTTRKTRGAALFKPEGSRAIVYQTTLRGGTLEPQKATEGTMTKDDGVLIITLP